MLIVAPAFLGLTVLAVLTIGPLGLMIPAVAAALVYLYRMVVQSSLSFEGKVVAREVGAGLMAIAVGFGAWGSAIILGVFTEMLPFLADGQDYPYADAWNAGSVGFAILVVPATWWVLRRFADPGLRGHRTFRSARDSPSRPAQL